MIRLNFSINPTYLAFYTLVQCERSRFISSHGRQDVVKFQNRAWEIDRDAYEFLRWRSVEDIIVNRRLSSLAVRAQKLLDEVAVDPAFVPLLLQTKEAQQMVEQEWAADYELSYAMMCQLTGVALQGDFNVMITHPSQINGHNNHGTICVTYRDSYPHFNTIYLWHELMHIFIPASDTGGDWEHVEHSIIELLTDDQLRVAFNGGSYPPFTGHEYLRPTKERLMPTWQEYLQQPDRQIKAFINSTKDAFAPQAV
jgi:hypothetical protein